MNWRSFDAVALERAYNPQKTVKDFSKYQTHRNARSVECRETMKSFRDIPYGPGELQKVDVYPAGPGSPVNLFYHGGYWRTQDKKNFAFLAGTFVPKGITTVVVNYPLCPAVTLDEVVESARESVTWAYRSIAQYDGDPDRITVSGNSAGAHLCSMLLASDWAARGLPEQVIRGAVMFSGIYDPEPARWIPVNEEIGLSAEQASRNNSMAMEPKVNCPTWIGAGGQEPWLWLEQTYEYSQHLRRYGLDPEVHILPGFHHFSVMDQMMDPEGVIARAVEKQAKS